jgi:hypothetical protein
MKGIFNLGCIHPPTQRIKQIYRRELEKKPDPQIAWQLATIIRNGLAGSHLAWAAPSNSSSTRWNREDPNESFTTLAEALDVVFEHSEPNSPLWKKAGLSLAKLRLMQGDWNGMNNALRQLGQDPVPAERRPNLPAPPADWDNLKRDWQPAAEVVRSGTCGVEFRFLRRGQKLQGIPGIHVLVKKHRPDPAAFRTGFRADTIFYATLPMVDAQPYDSFGYRAADRDQTRYGVSDENGLVRITGLPKTPLLVEILVPTANFTEPGHTWDFLMATPNGLKIADRQDPRSIDSHKPPALIELQEDALLRYPIMFVRSQLSANVHDWDTVDEDFVLTWNGLSENAVDYYDVKLSLSAPEQHPSIRNRSAAIGTQTVQVRGKSWPIGQRGVGKLRLVPGNIYLLEIDAVRNDRVVAILPSLRVWVPWEHRDSKPPLTGISGSRPAVYERIFIRTNVSGKSLEVRLPDLIRDAPEMYETEYHQLCLAWLDLHKKKKGAAGRLRKLIVELPEGNVVRTTGQSFLDAVANGQALSSRLHFVGPTR